MKKLHLDPRRPCRRHRCCRVTTFWPHPRHEVHSPLERGDLILRRRGNHSPKNMEFSLQTFFIFKRNGRDFFEP